LSATVDAFQRHAVLEAIAVLELAEEPVGEDHFEALRDPALRAQVATALGAAGRVLVSVDDGWTSGYDDTIADRLADNGIGILRPDDRAVLTLVLLRSVAAPRARGRLGTTGWTGEPTTIDDLALNRHLTKARIQAAVRRLRRAGVLRPGHRAALVPGPQFDRLTPERSQRLWEDLVIVCQPQGMLAEVIRRRHAALHDHATGPSEEVRA
jgi:hypothetical protein